MPETNSVSIQTQINQIKQKIDESLKLATSLGVSSAEIAITRQRGLAVTTHNKEVETVEFNQDGVLGITVFRDGRKGSASTSDLSEDALERTVRAACEISKHTSVDDCAGLVEEKMIEWAPKDLDLYHPYELTPEQAIDMAIEAETTAMDYSDKITNSDGVSCAGYEGFRVYGNTHGMVAGYPSSRYSLNCSVIGTGKEDMQRDSQYTVSRCFDELKAPKQVGLEAAEATVAKLDSTKLDTLRAPVIFRADIANTLFSHLVSAIGGGSIYRNSSFLVDCVGKQVMADCVNIQERPHMLRGLASSPFDSEGSKTFERDIITNGTLNTYLLAAYAARKLGMQSTGHAGGIHNWLVESTMGDLDAMCKSMDKGLIVTELMGQGVNVVNGDYSRGAGGFWVENGKIQYPVNEVTIAGNLSDIFKNIAGIGSDVDHRGNVQSGSILISEMQISGN